MLHISQMIDHASEATSQIKVTKANCLMEIMKDDLLSQEQKAKLVELLKPLDKAISNAQSSFSFETK
jgi:hypothetical protein